MKLKLMILSLVVFSGSAFGFAYYTKNTKSQDNASRTIEKLAKRPDMPVVVYTPKETVQEIMSKGEAGALQWKRQAVYDYPPGTPPEELRRNTLKEQSGYICGLPSSHFSDNEALPVKTSDIIVIAQVKSAEAFLSNDRTNVFSQFNAEVSSTLKTNVRPFQEKEQIILIRYGGAVRFESGAVAMRGGCDQTMPLVGRTYLFFLKSRPSTLDFAIMTAYELRGDTVFPLDGTDLVHGSQHRVFEKYKGIKKSDLLQRIAQKGGV